MYACLIQVYIVLTFKDEPSKVTRSTTALVKSAPSNFDFWGQKKKKKDQMS